MKREGEEAARQRMPAASGSRERAMRTRTAEKVADAWEKPRWEEAARRFEEGDTYRKGMRVRISVSDRSMKIARNSNFLLSWMNEVPPSGGRLTYRETSTLRHLGALSFF